MITRTFTAQQGKSIRSLLDLLTKLKVDHHTARLTMYKHLGMQQNEYAVTIYMRSS